MQKIQNVTNISSNNSTLQYYQSCQVKKKVVEEYTLNNGWCDMTTYPLIHNCMFEKYIRDNDSLVNMFEATDIEYQIFEDDDNKIKRIHIHKDSMERFKFVFSMLHLMFAWVNNTMDASQEAYDIALDNVLVKKFLNRIEGLKV